MLKQGLWLHRLSTDTNKNKTTKAGCDRHVGYGWVLVFDKLSNCHDFMKAITEVGSDLPVILVFLYLFRSLKLFHFFGNFPFYTMILRHPAEPLKKNYPSTSSIKK